jgi:hypothetical protein
MTRQRGFAAAVVACLLLGLMAVAPSALSGPATKAPPYKIGNSWTYRHTLVPATGETQIGTMKETFRGQTEFRGRTYYRMDVSYTLNPMSERVYLEWTGTHFRQVATVASDNLNNTIEILFNKPIDLGVETEGSGAAVILQNGVQKGTSAWSFSASSRGRVKVTVPAGTFQATEWDAVLRIGASETLMKIYAVGILDVRMESKISASGSPAGAWYKELMSGPVR